MYDKITIVYTMRFMIYLIIVAVAVTFFIYRQETILEPIVPVSSVSSPYTLSGPVTETVTTTPKTIEKTKPVVQPKLKIDQTTLDQIQTKLNQASQTITDIGKQPATPPLPRLSQQILYDKAVTRVVNFFCQQGSNVRTASGIIISPAGYILTNAHVAQGFSSDFECVIRQGSPARNLAYAKIVMFPKAYTNATTRQEQADNDVSIWKITRLAGDNPITDPFPYYQVDPTYYPEVNQPLATFSYPAELLGYETILKSLNMFFAETIVDDFDRDLILSSTGLSSQVGSSGGILVDVYTNKFAGLIFAVSKDDQINKRKLFSLTPASVERVVETETGLSLAEFLSK